MADTSNISLFSRIDSNETAAQNNEEFDLSKSEDTSLESTKIASQVETIMSLKPSDSTVVEEGENLDTSQAHQSVRANVTECENLEDTQVASQVENVLLKSSLPAVAEETQYLETSIANQSDSASVIQSEKEVENDSMNEQQEAGDDANITKATVDGITTYTINDSMGRREISVALNQLEPNENNTRRISQRVSVRPNGDQDTLIQFFSDLNTPRQSMVPPPLPAQEIPSTSQATHSTSVQVSTHMTSTNRQVPEPTREERATAEQQEMLDIQRLIRMGFDEGDVIMAYYQSCRNIRRAAHKLVDIMF